MVNGIHGPNNGGSINGRRLKSLPVRTISARNLMRSPALKPMLLQWHMAKNAHAVYLLEEMLSLELPVLNSIKDDISRMDDNKLLCEATEITNRFVHSHLSFLGSEPVPTLIEFIERKRSPICPVQFYASNLTATSSFSKRISEIIGPEIDAKILQYMKDAYRNVLTFTLGLEVLSKRHDFTPFLKNILLPSFPQIEKEIMPADYLAKFDAEEILAAALLIKYMNEEMKIDFNKVEIKPLIGSNDVAIIKNDVITINLPTLSTLNLYVSKFTEKRIKIEK